MANVVRVRANIKLRSKPRIKPTASSGPSAMLLQSMETQIQSDAEKCQQQLLQLEHTLSGAVAESRQELGLSKVRLRLMECVKVQRFLPISPSANACPQAQELGQQFIGQLQALCAMRENFKDAQLLSAVSARDAARVRLLKLQEQGQDTRRLIGFRLGAELLRCATLL